MVAPITKHHRLSVARAWEGDEPFSEFMQRWVETGEAKASAMKRVRLNNLAQLVADAEASAWVPVAVGLPDSDVQVMAINHKGDRVLVTLEFTDDSEGNGEPYWAAEDWDAALSDYPHWRALPAAPKPPEQP